MKVTNNEIVEEYFYKDLLRFTTAGPVAFDGFREWRISDSPPQPFLYFKLALRNEGSLSPGHSIRAEIIPKDSSNIFAIDNNHQSFGIINPGETKVSPNWYFIYLDTLMNIFNFDFLVNIYSGEHLLWSDSSAITVGIAERSSILPSDYFLSQNYPNPFNPSTIEFDLPKASEVTLKVFNILGEEVATLVSDKIAAGSYSYEWSRPAGIASGVYLYRLNAGEYVDTRKMMLMI